MARFFIVEQNARDMGGHYFSYTKVIAQAAVDQGYDVYILANQHFNGDYGVDGITVVPTFHYTWLQAMWQPPKVWRPGMFSFDLSNAFYDLGKEDGDIVFIHTIGDEELTTLFAYLADLPPSDHGQFFHILLRYDPADMARTLNRFQPQFAQLRQSKYLREKVIFHADTSGLAQRFSRLSGLDFNVAPIPFDTAVLEAKMGKADPIAGNEDCFTPSIRIAYVGDARREKNYQQVPSAVQQVFESPSAEAAKLRFSIQSNFNIPGGEEGIADARQALETLQRQHRDRISLTYAQLDTSDYLASIADADAIYVAYDARHYRLRSSGILIEAMAAGKPVIVTRGSWMAEQVDDSHAVTIDDVGRLGDGFLALAENFEALSKAAEEKAERIRDGASGTAFIDYLTRLTPTVELGVLADDRPHILVLAEGGQYKYPNGSRRIFEQQLDFLERAGFRVSVLFAFSSPVPVKDRPVVIRHLNQLISRYRVSNSFFVFKSSALSDVTTSRLGDIWQGIKQSIRFDMLQSEAIDLPSDLVRFLRTEKIDRILLNYITRFPIIEALGLDDIPVICEMHDIQSRQRAIYGRRAFGSRDWDLESRYLAKCEALISLNKDESSFIEEELPTTPVHTTGYFAEARGEGLEPLIGIGSVRDAVAASVPDRGNLRWAEDEQGGVSLPNPVLDGSKIDLFFVGSNHQPNKDGLSRFLTEVYTPYLKDHGVSMLVAGSMAASIDVVETEFELPSLPHVYGLGPVADLRPLYASARLIVLPIWEGAGLSIKTIEAMAEGKPVVATDIAMRSIDAAYRPDTMADDPAAMAEMILSLLNDRERRRRLSVQTRERFHALCDPTRYDMVMSKVLHTSLAQDKQRTRLPVSNTSGDHPGEGQLREISPTILRLNRLMMAWLNGLYFEQDVPLTGLCAAEARALIAAYRRLLAGEFDIWDVPAFSSNPKAALAIVNRIDAPDTLDKFDQFVARITAG